jgi:RNA polymerase sigma-70 factor, ECF subfamily
MICITTAWDKHESELRNYLREHVGNNYLAEDLLQETFVKALANNQQFCRLDNPRVWLFRVAKNALIDFRRTDKEHAGIENDIPELNDEVAPVVNLSKCLPQAIKKLSSDDQEIIQYCDLDSLNQNDYAQKKAISLASAKSRIQRARKRLKFELDIACKIVLDEQGKVCCFDPNCQ